MSDTTILYFTDSVLDETLAKKCRDLIYKASGGRRIVSVSQKPLDYGDNFCVGEIGRSGLSFDLQIYEGAKQIKTRFVAIAEHDVVYPSEHFDFVPPDDTYFYYNMNVWFAQYNNPLHPELNGMFSYWRGRKAHSQLICNAERYLEACKARYEITSDKAWSKRYQKGRIAEPGAVNYDHTIKLSEKEDVKHLQEKLRAYMNDFVGKEFKTKIPTLDLRHGDNFSGARRGKKRCYELPHWGKLSEVLK